MTRFNPNITAAEFNALPPKEQEEWSRRLLDFWSEGDQNQMQRDFQHDHDQARVEGWGEQK